MNLEQKEVRKLIDANIENSKSDFTLFDGAFLTGGFLVVLALIVSKVV